MHLIEQDLEKKIREQYGTHPPEETTKLKISAIIGKDHIEDEKRFGKLLRGN